MTNRVRRTILALLASVMLAALFMTLVGPARSATATGTIAGRITNRSGQGLGDATIQTVSGPTSASPATTSPDGSYVLAGLRPGRYELLVAGPHGRYVIKTIPNVNVTAGATTTVNAQLVLAGRIAGVARNPNGTPLSNVAVLDSGGKPESFTSANGRFEIDGLAPGRARVTLRYVRGRIVNGTLRVSGPPELKRIFPKVVSGKTTHVTVRLPASACCIGPLP
jgi:hypothetical protein